MTIGQRLVKTAQKALDELARREFSREKVLEACQVAAIKGFMSCQIRPTLPVDLSGTQHMKDLRAELEKERIHTAFIPYGMPGERPFNILEIRWEARQ